MKVLVTGGSGYIGAVTLKALAAAGFEPINFDLKQGNDIRNKQQVLAILKDSQIGAVMHFAAFISMGESMINPFKYFDNNVHGSLELLQAMVEAKVNKLIFSSSAGVYGNPVSVPIKETDPTNPTNPYGQSKLMVEQMLNWYDKIHQLKSIAIRYFNAAGADKDLGETHQPESHLIPNVIAAAAAKKQFKLFGDDYPTPDGSCVRDYIHVSDLAEAHLLTLKALIDGHKSDVYNAGTGKGYSNKEVISMVEKISGKKIDVKVEPRRPGDTKELVADSSKLQKEFNWQPKKSDLKTIVEYAYAYHTSKV